MRLSSFEDMRGNLRVEIGCPFCGTRLHDGQIVGETASETNLSHFQCDSCAHYCLALTFQSQLGISSVVLVTDLCFDDALRLRGKRSVSADDVIYIHELLNRDDAVLMFKSK